MTASTRAKIFLSADRGHTETDWFRSYNTFNFGGYHNEHKKPFETLYVLNDDTLAGGKQFALTVEEDSQIFLLPTVGAITYKDSSGNETAVEAGEFQCGMLPKGTTMELANPYEAGLINFLQLWIRIPAAPALTAPVVHPFDLANNKNNLLHLEFSANPAQRGAGFFIGKYDGRREGFLKMASGNTGVFAFVIEGAFEVQNRLLHPRDGLALWDVREVEFEALSNDAIILFVLL